MKRFYSKHKLQSILLIWLNTIMIVAFIIATVIGLFMQNKMQHEHIFSIMDSYLQDCVKDIDVPGEVDYYYGLWIETVEGGEGKERYYDNEHLRFICEANADRFCEASIVNASGDITYSSNPELIGVNIDDSDSLKPFRCLLEGESAYYDDLSKNPFNEDVDIVHCGRAFKDGSGFILFGMDERNYEYTLGLEIQEGSKDGKVGVSGYFIFCDTDKRILYLTKDIEDLTGDVFSEESLLPKNEGEIKNTITALYGEKCYVSALRTPDYYIIDVYPTAEADRFMLQNNAMVVVLFFTILSVFFITFFIVIKRKVIRDVEETHGTLKLITDGNLDEKVEASGSLEFAELSEGINETVGKLKGLIREEEERVKTELQNAKNIQESAVPTVFPEDERFELFASMDTAEAVGGDFYDFFMRDENTLVFVMADVSGKGMPAALYMMRAKTLIKTYAEQGLSVEEVATETNKRLCEDASRDMFVTAWIGFLELDTGVLSYVHAGHTLPVLIRGGELADNAKENGVGFVKKKINTVLGGLRKAKYMRQEITLNPGDSIYLYTDGVTEAHDVNGGMYGDERLLSFITEWTRASFENPEPSENTVCRAACEAVLSDVNSFVGKAEQFDDITMMWVKYYGER